jgi:perosamine synthetase
MIPYGKQSIDDDDINEVVKVLQSDWLTTGPLISQFEKAVCNFTGAQHGIAVSNGTAALHCAAFAAGIKEGDEVIVTPFTFAASANVILYQKAVPVFADIDRNTLLLNPDNVRKCITNRTRAVIAVDYAGQPCAYDKLRTICDEHNLTLISDSCHSIGATLNGRPVTEYADLTAYSFHPVKHFTTGEGGMVVTNNKKLAEQAKKFRNHGIEEDLETRTKEGTWFYKMTELGYNYRLTDIQCALGISQIKKLPDWIKKRKKIASKYNLAFNGHPALNKITVKKGAEHVYHLYVIKLKDHYSINKREKLFEAFRKAGIGVNVHYLPVHLHPYYKKHLNTRKGMFPIAENASERILSLPMYSSLKDEEIKTVIETTLKLLKEVL